MTINHAYPGQGSPPTPSPPFARFQSQSTSGRDSPSMRIEEDASLFSSDKDDHDSSLRIALRKFSAAFFLLGLLNNVLYVIILSAALDLVPADVPKGVILFVNITPALLVKIGWPYFVPGRVRYGRRVLGCSLISFLGIILVATSNTLTPRLFGIALASFSSGLGEMTFLQLTTCYNNNNNDNNNDNGYSKKAVGWFSSGTGAAGLVGAGLWWELRGLGVKRGISISSILPICMGIVYFLLLPKPTIFHSRSNSAYMPISTREEEQEDNIENRSFQSEHQPNYSRISQHEEEQIMNNDNLDDTATRLLPSAPGISTLDTLIVPISKSTLSTKQKLEIAKPLFWNFMLPLFVVYFAEYTVNTGVSPTLLYPVPDKNKHPILGTFIKKLSDYYPLWQLIYQTFVFFSRSSSVIFHVPPLPMHLIALPSILQFCVLLIGLVESTHQVFTSIFGPAYAIGACTILIALEGLFGGTAYVNAYLRVGHIEEKKDNQGQILSKGDILARREFRMACVGFADTLGILAASLVSSWLEPTLCGIQVDSGRNLCREVK